MRSPVLLCLVVAMLAGSVRAEEGSYESGLGQKIPGFRELGIDLTAWDWLEYGVSSQSQQRTSWGNEFELDLTKTFYQRVSLAADLEFIDYDDDRYVQAEQLFTSILLSRDSGALLTIGKFNSPFGVERRDFWDRSTGTPSLLFRAQPEDLRGVMLTAPIDKTGITLQPFVVSGFGDENEIPGRPAAGMMVTYKPNEQWTFGVTNWIGPGMESDGEYDSSGKYGAGSYSVGYGGYSGGYYHKDSYGYGGGGSTSAGGGSSYSNSVFELTNVWKNPEFESSRNGRLYFLDLSTTWRPRADLMLQAGYLLATSDAEDGAMWTGVMALASYDIDQHWRAFAQWSFLNDPQGKVFDYGQQRQEVNTGLAYRINSHIEMRGEYRHDWSTQSGDIDSVSVHLSIGY